MPSTSFVIRLEILSNNAYGSGANLAVIASLDNTALMTTKLSKDLLPFLTPVDLTPGTTQKYCHSFLCKPAFSISCLTIASASWISLILYGVTSPIDLTPNPGPGNGCRLTNWSGRPRTLPTALTCGLYSIFNGSTKPSLRSFGNPPTLW